MVPAHRRCAITATLLNWSAAVAASTGRCPTYQRSHRPSPRRRLRCCVAPAPARQHVPNGGGWTVHCGSIAHLAKLVGNPPRGHRRPHDYSSRSCSTCRPSSTRPHR
jgi:hypothetical protein